MTDDNAATAGGSGVFGSGKSKGKPDGGTPPATTPPPAPGTPDAGGTPGGSPPLAIAPAVPPYKRPFPAQLARYMDSSLPIYADSDVKHLIKGVEYFPAVLDAINSLGGDVSKQFIYVTGWCLDPNFSLSGQGASPTLIDVLAAKSKAGADVRVLGDAMAPEMVPYLKKHSDQFNWWLETMQFIEKLRNAEPTMRDKAVLNTLPHPVGAVHMKMFVVGSQSGTTGFVGGMDCRYDRHASNWHDVAVMVKGSVTQTLISAFAAMWNEIQGRLAVTISFTAPTAITVVNRTSGMPKLTAAGVVGSGGKTLRTQSVRTLPQFNIASGFPANTPLSYAPSGVTEVMQVWKKAISAAQNYIYVEDQGFSSTDVFDWMNSVFKGNSRMRIILVTGAVDPGDAGDTRPTYFFNFVNDHLLNGITAKPDLDRIAIFSNTGNIVHSKTTIIDDQWAIIGSANFMRRSLFTDIEHSISFMDDQGIAVPAYRDELWSLHLGSSYSDMVGGLNAWFGPKPAGSQLTRMPVPLPIAAGSAETMRYNNLIDANSHDVWPVDPSTMKIIFDVLKS